jgi:hypothetical protein
VLTRKKQVNKSNKDRQRSQNAGTEHAVYDEYTGKKKD